MRPVYELILMLTMVFAIAYAIIIYLIVTF